MISKGVKQFCCEDISLIENYQKAINDSNETWHCHHRLEIQGDIRYSRRQLIEMKLYYERPASELIFLTLVEHSRIHWLGKKRGKFSDEHKKKLSERKIGNSFHTGCKNSEESKAKMSIAAKNRKNRVGYTKGKHRVYDNFEHTKWHME